MRKRLVSLIIAAALILMCVPAYAVSGDEVVYGSCGEHLTWILNSLTGYLRITGEGEMYDYESGASPFYPYRTFITQLDIRDGVTHVGSCAFTDCALLASVSFPESLTSIGERAFKNCTALTSLEMPAGVSSVGSEAFRYCASLYAVTFLGEAPDEFGEFVFQGCEPSFTIYYPYAYASSWAPEGGTTWHGYNIAPFDAPALMGDIDGDGEITSGDALIALRISMGIVFVTPEMAEAGDMDGDGDITSGDALIILRLSMAI